MSPDRRPALARVLAAAGGRRVGRAPFVLLVVALLSSGLISLLLLNASINQGAFELSRLKQQTTDYTDQEQALQVRVDQDAAPGTLAERARRLGMVPGGDPAFLTAGGAVRGGPSAPAQGAAPSTAPAAPPASKPGAPLTSIAASPSPTTGR